MHLWAVPNVSFVMSELCPLLVLPDFRKSSHQKFSVDDRLQASACICTKAGIFRHTCSQDIIVCTKNPAFLNSAKNMVSRFVLCLCKIRRLSKTCSLPENLLPDHGESIEKG